MKKVALVLGVLTVSVVLLLWFLCGTQQGLRLVVRSARTLSGEQLQIGEASGRLGDRVSLKGVRYTSESADIEIGTMDFSWNPFELLQGILHIRHFGLDGLQVVTTGEKSDDSAGGFSLPNIGLPFEIAVDSLEITSFRLESQASTITTVDRLELRVAAERKRLELSSLQLQSDLVDLRLAGSVGMAAGWPVDFSGSWNVKPPGTTEIGGDLRLQGTLTDGRLVIEALSPFSAVLDTGFRFQENLAFDSKLEAEAFDPSHLFAELPANLDIVAEASGKFGEGGLQADLALARLTGEVNGFVVEAYGNGRFIDGLLTVESLQVKHHSTELTAQGRLGDRVEASFTAVSPDISIFLADAQGRAEVSGTVTGDIANPGIRAELQASSLSYNDMEVSEAVVKAETEAVREGRMAVEAVLKNSRLWGQSIDTVSVKGSGTPAEHRLELDIIHPETELILAARGGLAGQVWQGEVERLTVEPQEVAPASLDGPAKIRVSAEEIQVEPLCLVQSEAKICMQGMLREHNWQARVELDDFNPQLIAGDWPGRIDGVLSGQGSLAEESPQSTLTLSELEGELRSMQVGGSGLAEIRGAAVELKRLDLEYGQASLQAAGRIGEDRYDLSFSADMPDIGSLVPGWRGQISGHGVLAGKRAAPIVRAEVTAKNIGGESFSLEDAVADLDMDLRQSGTLAAKISILGLQGFGRTLTEGDIDFSGTTASHAFDADLRFDIGRLVVEGNGAYDNGWQGVLAKMQLDSQEYGQYHLDRKSSITIGAVEGEIDTFCPVGEKIRMCLSASWDEQRQWRLQSDIDSFDLSLLSDAGLLAVVLDGAVEGEYAARGVGGSLEQVIGSLRAGEIELAETGGDQRLKYVFFDNRIDFDMRGTKLETELRSNFGGEGDVRADIVFDMVTDGSVEIADIPLRGSLAFDLADLTFIALLTNSHVQPTGTLRGNLSLDGRLGRPRTAGEVHLDNGSIFIRSVGIALEDVSADILNQGERLDYTLTARSGKGKAKGEGNLQFDFNGGWALTSQVTGEDFRLMDTDQYVIDVTPDIDLRLGDGENYIRGRFTVPYARITLKRKESKVTPSGDVVIVDSTTGESRHKNGLSIDLQVALGDDVAIDAYGLKSSLAGSLDIENSPGRLLTGVGELMVEGGEFSFYSVELEVTRGRLLFSGGAIENPGVDFRAQRKVEDKVVGVEVSGTADNFDISLFSDPAMDESNILAYMLVGRSLYASSENQQSLIDAAANAVGIRGFNTITNSLQQYLPVDEIYLDGSTTSEDISLVMGKHITDDIFVGYDHNFFDSSGEFKIRYDLGGNFSVETRSSVDSTSGDILYTIEK